MDPARAGCQELGTAQFLCAAWLEKPPRISPRSSNTTRGRGKKFLFRGKKGVDSVA